MPESVTDRPTRAHEQIFLLSKRARYYFDAVAVQEDAVQGYNGSRLDTGKTAIHQLGRASEQERVENGKRNLRSVWTIPTAPFPGAHFAVFPPALVTPCILAGTSERGCCAACGAPHQRQLQEGEPVRHRWTDTVAKNDASRNDGTHGGKATMVKTFSTVGWHPSCSCNEATRPCVVLDPFGGAGTTGMVALGHGRDAILIELNPEYARMAAERVRNDAPLLNEVSLISTGAVAA